MKIGQKAWYTESLWLPAVRVTITRVEHDLTGACSWIEAKDKSGHLYTGYPVQFPTEKPVLFR